MPEFKVKEGSVLEEPADLLLLKYAQDFYGADKAVALHLISARLCRDAELRPRPGDFVVIETNGAIAPKRVLFLGTPPLGSFNYDEMEVFARRAIEKIADLRAPIQDLTTTVHGTGYGLDAGEALQRLVQGFQDGLSTQRLRTIERITFLTLERREERMLSAALGAMAIDVRMKKAVSAAEFLPGQEEATGTKKPRVFVALPFSEEFQNVYEFGIYPAVRNCGFICERVDETHFTGDVLARIRGGIEAADLVIADLTEGRPNVYLEVGYAWGKAVPVIFVAKKGENLHFDVSTHRCIFYGKFSQFAKDLEALIRGIEATRQH
ncbi:MAG TPA: hypothetical protein VJK71_07330 [Gemmatimonadales bacterium]|nr:hypothetical protein [Gemmatimonadales bacterium]